MRPRCFTAMTDALPRVSTRTLLPLNALLVLALAPEVSRAGESKPDRPAPRARVALENTEAALKEHFTKQGLEFPPREIFLRAFKTEAQLELWAKGADRRWRLAKTYPFCMASGGPGPKRRRGDLQVPEGFYHIDRFNPWSDFHLSLGINYPNEADRRLGQKADLGGDIFIHGSCVSIGCIAITDPLIEEVYTLAWLARGRGQNRIPVHIFPARMDETSLAPLRAEAAPELLRFWDNLAEGYRWFQEKETLPRVRVNPQGMYQFAAK